MAKEFILPDLGEGIEEGDVVRVLVSEGDEIEADQPVLELETDKALIEVPSPFGGTVASIKVKSGDRVPVGAVLLTVEGAAPGESEPSEAEPEPAEAAVAVEAPAAEFEEEPSSSREPARGPVEEPAEEPTSPEAAPAPPTAEKGAPVPAAPSTRRFARELGVDLGQVTGSGPGGRIVEEDVKGHVQAALSGRGGGSGAPPPLPDFTKWGDVERRPLRSIQRKAIEHMGLAWSQVPHVTQFEEADVTELEAFRQRHKDEAEARGGRLTPTVLILKAVVNALKAFPQFNASLDVEAEELVLKEYYHIGVAVDTDRGLLVPVIRDAERKDIFELALELGEVAERTRQGKIELETLQGGTFTITNLGTIAGTAFTPIVNYPEVSILGISRSREEPVVRDGRIDVRLLMPLALSYDHRVVNGADGARFIKHLAASLEDPGRLLLGG